MTDNVGMKTRLLEFKPNNPIVIGIANNIATPQQIATFNSMSEMQRKSFWKAIDLSYAVRTWVF